MSEEFSLLIDGNMAITQYCGGMEKQNSSFAGRPDLLRSRGECIFCRSADATKEDVWPSWMHHAGLLGREMRIKFTGASPQFGYPNISIRSHLTGSMARLIVKRLCKCCNNDWGSNIQSRSKPIIMQALDRSIDKMSMDMQNIIFDWAMCFSMCVEFVTPQEVGISQYVREMFRHGHPLPESFSVHVGRYAGTAFHLGYQHNYSRMLYSMDGEPKDLSKVRLGFCEGGPGVQATVVAIGKLVMLVTSIDRCFGSEPSNFEELAIPEDAYGDFGLVRIPQGGSTDVIDFASLPALYDKSVQDAALAIFPPELRKMASRRA